MGNAWMLAPILPIIVGIALVLSIVGVIVSNIANLQSFQQSQSALPAVAAILSFYLLGIIALYLILLIDSISIYYLLDRRNNHFKRQQQLFATIAKYLMTRSNELIASSSKLLEMSEDAAAEEENRSAGLWAVLNLFVSPFVSLIAAYNLTRDLRRHEDRQQNYQTILTSTLNQMSVTAPPVPARLHKRDPLLFLILTAISGGLFWIYWFYTLLKDYNEHFKDQALFEDQVLVSLKPRILNTQCQGCSAQIPRDTKFCPFCGKSQQT
jgi:H+/Cl- antiporter ClcA